MTIATARREHKVGGNRLAAVRPGAMAAHALGVRPESRQRPLPELTGIAAAGKAGPQRAPYPPLPLAALGAGSHGRWGTAMRSEQSTSARERSRALVVCSFGAPKKRKPGIRPGSLSAAETGRRDL